MVMEDEGRWLKGDAHPKTTVHQRQCCPGEGPSVSSTLLAILDADEDARGEDTITSRASVVPDPDKALKGEGSVTCADRAPAKCSGRIVHGQQTSPTIQRPSLAPPHVLGEGIERSVKQSVETPKKKLLILDLNGLLLVAIYKSAPKVGLPANVVVGNFKVYIRPGCEEFVKFCLKQFEVAVWSSGMKDKVSGLVEAAFGSRRKELLFVWSQVKCTLTKVKDPTNSWKGVMLKELSVVRSAIWERGFDEFNTLLIDDTPYKVLRNPSNTAVHPKPWTAHDVANNGLFALRDWLHGLSTAETVTG